MTGRQLIHSQSAPERERPDAAPLAAGLHVAKSASGRLERGQSVANSDGAKARKPYVITKQRERWTDAEHARFLEALRLHGRAWRRIEEHIGTKTAVQIRSHAQKFFSKLEREQAAGNTSVLPENLNIPPPRPKRKPAHPYPRKAEPQSSEPLLPAQSWSGSLPTLAAAAAAAAPSQQQQHGGAAQARGVSHGPRHPVEAGLNARPSPFSAVQQQVHSRLHQLPADNATSLGAADRQQQHAQQLPADGHAAAVAAVAAAASAAAAAAAAAVVAAAEAHVQASLQANPPKGFPFFGLPPSLLASMGLQLQNEAQASALEQLRLQGQVSGPIGSLSLAPSLLTPAPSGSGGLNLLAHPDAGAMQGLGQALVQSTLQPNVAALSTLARLACSGGLAGLTAATAAGVAPEVQAQQQQAFAGHTMVQQAGRTEAGAADERTATNVPDGRPGAVQAADDGSDELRRNSSKRNTSDGDSACSREHAADGNAAAPTAAAVNAAISGPGDFVTDPFAAWRVAQGLAAANNAAACASWAAAAGGLPIAALLTASSGGVAMSGEHGVNAVPGSFAFPLANGACQPPALCSGYGTSLLSGGHNGTPLQQPKPKRSSGGKGSAFTHAGTASGQRTKEGGSGGGSVGRSNDGSATVAAKPVESRSSHDRLRDSESPCNNTEAPHNKCSKAAGNGSGSNDSHSSELQAGYGFGSDEGSNPTGNGSSGEGSNEGGNANGSDDDNKGTTTQARLQGNGTSKATAAGGGEGQQPTAEVKAGQAHERAAAQTRPHQGTLLHSDGAQALGRLPVIDSLAGSHAGSGGGGGDDGGEEDGKAGNSDDRRSSCTLPEQLGVGATSGSHYPGPAPAIHPQAANAAAAAASTLLQPEAMQALLAGHRMDASAAAAEGVAAAALGHTQGAGTMQELLLSLRAAAAAGGGDVQRMFGPLYGDWQAFIKQHQAAAQNLQHQRTLPSLSGVSGGSPTALAGTHSGGRPLQTVSAGGGGSAFGGGGKSAFNGAGELRTFSGGFQPYNRAATQHSAPTEGGLKRSTSSSRMDVPPRKRLNAGYWDGSEQQ